MSNRSSLLFVCCVLTGCPGKDSETGDTADTDTDTNTGQAKPVDELVEGELVITEIMNNPSAVDDDLGEWFEVYNAAGQRVDLSGLVISDGDDNTFTVTDSVLVNAESYTVFGNNADSTANGGVEVDVAYAGITLSNGADSVHLDSATLRIDGVTYDDAVFPDVAGSSMTLAQFGFDAEANDLPENWCTATSVYGVGDLGTPGVPNDACDPGEDLDQDGYSSLVDCDDGDSAIHPDAAEIWYDGIDQNCDGASDYDQDFDGEVASEWGGPDCDDTDPARRTTACEIPGDGVDQDCDTTDAVTGATWNVLNLVPGSLVINEIMKDANRVEDELGEWFEVFNATAESVDLRGMDLRDQDGEATCIRSSLIVPPGELVVLGINADVLINGGVAVDYQYEDVFRLSNGGDEVILGVGATVIDQVSYDGGDTFPDLPGVSLTLSPTSQSATDNDSGANWCGATSSYGAGDAGTPGAGNDSCATP